MTNKHSRPVGQELQNRREELGYSLHKVEVATKIRGRYLRAIEASDFASLPNDIYSRGFVRQYAAFLGLDGPELAKRYQAERGKPDKLIRQVKPRALELRLGATSRWVASLVALGAIAIIVGYLLWQFSSLTAAPKLELVTPAKDAVVNTSTIEVKGTTAAGADIFLNDAPLPSDVNGVFKTTLILQPGINEVRIVAKNKLGKETKLTRNILNKQVKSEDLPAATFNGVALLVTANDASVIKIAADGKTVYEGSIAKDGNRLVTAKDTIAITSSNAAALSAKFTNTLVASYDFGALGSDSAPRTVEFTKTTQVPQ